MKRAIWLNVLLNVVLAVAFVLLNVWALSRGLEESFVAFAILYGRGGRACNAAYVAGVCARGRVRHS
jgi:hypothetical protein